MNTKLAIYEQTFTTVSLFVFLTGKWKCTAENLLKIVLIKFIRRIWTSLIFTFQKSNIIYNITTYKRKKNEIYVNYGAFGGIINLKIIK